MSDLTGGNWALEPASLVDLSVNRLREEILSGLLAPGERLVEERLTSRLGISRAPLREALLMLGQQGLVEHLPRRGARVARLSRTDVDELFSLRDVLERFVVETALPVKDKAELRELEAALESMASAAESGAALQGTAAHCRFHVALAALAGHRQLLLVYEPIIVKLQLYMAANL
ncbi:MAG: GntR family transcriptional regulator, partial [Mycobacteriaceae bacterium]